MPTQNISCKKKHSIFVFKFTVGQCMKSLCCPILFFLGYGTSDQWTRVVDVSMNVLG